MTRFLPPTKAVTSKFSGMRSGPTTGWVRPVPALDFEGQALGPLAWILLSLQEVRPLPEILTVFGKSISIFEALVPSMLFLTNVVTLMDFGFFFVPDLVGETLVVAVTSLFWATATVAMARAASAAITAMRYLRKKVSSSGEMSVRTGTKARVTEPIRTYLDPATPQKFRRLCLALASLRVRAPAGAIPAPPFPRELEWINVAPLRMDKQRGRPVLVEFWDFCRVNSLRTLPYLIAWHERYAADGLRVLGIHASGFAPSATEEAVRGAVERLAVPYPVGIDVGYEVWQEYGNAGWPARYLWNPDGLLHSFHYGEGAYDETEREIQELL